MDLLLFHITRLFPLQYYYLESHRYSDNLDGLQNLFVKLAPFCSHNLFGISQNCVRSTNYFEENLYLPNYESPHSGTWCASRFNQMLFKSFRRVIHFLHVVFHNAMFVVAVVIGYFSYGLSTMFSIVTSTSPKYLLNFKEFLVYRQVFFFKVLQSDAVYKLKNVGSYFMFLQIHNDSCKL